MEYTFSERVGCLKPSAIREIFKYASDPSYISLSAGNPSPDAFPAREIADITNEILAKQPIDALQYSLTEGYPKLRNRMKNYAKESMGSFNDGIDELIITSGAQQVMDLAAKSLCNERDTVICESPSFIGSLNTFRSYNINLCGVPMDNDGINIDLLEKALKTQKNVRFIYLIPNFQNPSGITLSLKKRKAVYELAVKYNVLILEDNPYGDLRFYGENIPNIKSFDKTGHVIYAGTFSKIISPGLRVGFAIAPKDIITKMVVCKQGQDVHTNVLAQLIIDNFLEKCDIKLHLSNLQKLYKKKATYMEQLMERHFNGNITYNKIEGGLFVWCKIQIGIDIIDFCKAALEKKVCIIPGNTFMVDESEHTNAFRVTYSTPSKEQIEKGVKILGEIAKI